MSDMSELMIYGAIAAVVCFMLYMVLGKPTGESPDKTFLNDNFGDKLEKDVPEFESRSPAFDGPGGAGLSKIAAADAGFSPDGFLDGAKAAYSMILEAYAEGDKETLKSLLDDPVYDAYCAGIDERESQGLTQTTDLARLISAKLVSADRDGTTGSISVEYDAEIAASMTNAEGEVVDGDPDMLNRVVEIWTYERKLGSKTPDWLLTGVTEAGEDTLGSAPDFTPEKP